MPLVLVVCFALLAARSVDCGSCMPDIHIQAKLSARGFFQGIYILIDLTVLTSDE